MYWRMSSARFFFDNNSSLLPSPERRQAGPDPVCLLHASCKLYCTDRPGVGLHHDLHLALTSHTTPRAIERLLATGMTVSGQAHSTANNAMAPTHTLRRHANMRLLSHVSRTPPGM
jgi:hypothetical protein